MHPKHQKFVKKWQKQQQNGRTFYVLITGITWGLVAAIVSTLFRLGSGTLAEIYLSGSFLIKLIIMIAVGLFFHNWQWSFNNKKYDRLLREHSNIHLDNSNSSAH